MMQIQVHRVRVGDATGSVAVLLAPSGFEPEMEVLQAGLVVATAVGTANSPASHAQCSSPKQRALFRLNRNRNVEVVFQQKR